MKRIGFLVVNQRTGYMQEGKDHAARIFDGPIAARLAIRPMTPEVPVPLSYEDMVRSLLKGSSFCFDTDEGFNKFVARVRNDPGNRPFVAYCKDRTFVKWRHAKPELTQDIPIPTQDIPLPTLAPAEQAPVPKPEATMQFNPAILVK